jgi:hypothetical protein
MSDILFYWRDYKQNCLRQFSGEYAYYWHTNSKIMAELHAGDKLWFVTSGRNIGHTTKQAGFLVANWQVRDVVITPGDYPTYPAVEYRYRIVANPSASITFEEAIPVDHLLRPAGKDRSIGIGRFLQRPRVLSEEKVRALKEACGAQMALTYLKGRNQ